MFYDLKTVNCSVNWEIMKRLTKIEEDKKENGNVGGVEKPAYDVEDQAFRTLVDTIALSTTSFFSY
jgi:hypothetical protein